MSDRSHIEWANSFETDWGEKKARLGREESMTEETKEAVRQCLAIVDRHRKEWLKQPFRYQGNAPRTCQWIEADIREQFAEAFLQKVCSNE